MTPRSPVGGPARAYYNCDVLQVGTLYLDRRTIHQHYFFLPGWTTRGARGVFALPLLRLEPVDGPTSSEAGERK